MGSGTVPTTARQSTGPINHCPEHALGEAQAKVAGGAMLPARFSVPRPSASGMGRPFRPWHAAAALYLEMSAFEALLSCREASTAKRCHKQPSVALRLQVRAMSGQCRLPEGHGKLRTAGKTPHRKWGADLVRRHRVRSRSIDGECAPFANVIASENFSPAPSRWPDAGRHSRAI
jgi:hypothetical protein